VAPMANWVIVLGHVAGGVARGMAVGLVVTIVALFFTPIEVQHPFILWQRLLL